MLWAGVGVTPMLGLNECLAELGFWKQKRKEGSESQLYLHLSAPAQGGNSMGLLLPLSTYLSLSIFLKIKQHSLKTTCLSPSVAC